MLSNKLYSFTAVVAALLFTVFTYNFNGSASANDNSFMTDSEVQPDMTLAELVEVTERLSILHEALQETGLDEELGEEGPYTIFIPTDDAFEELSESDLDGLMEDEEKLKEVLDYHIVEGELASEQLTQEETVETRGGDAEVNTSASSIQVDDANVVQFDVQASNGIAHVVDQVMMP